MDFVNKAYTAILDLFKSMTPAARVTTGLLLVAIVVSTMFLFSGSISSVKTNLFPSRDLRPEDISRIQLALSKAGFNDYDLKGNQVWVALSKRKDAIKAIADDNALPAGSEDAAQLSMFHTQSQQKYQMLREKKKKIQGQIEQLTSVYRASVDLDERKMSISGLTERSCSVVATPSGGRALSEQTMLQIVRIVQGAFTGIKPENINVSDNNSTRSFDGRTLLSGGSQSLYKLRKEEFELSLRQKFREVLINFGDIQVNVDVELDKTVEQVTYARTVNPTTVPLETNAKKEIVSSRGDSGGGAPGTRSQQPGASANGSAVASRGSTMSKEITEENSRADASAELTKTRIAGLVPKIVKATIGVSAETVRKEYLRQFPPAAGEEDKPIDPTKLEDFFLTNFENKIRKKIANLIEGQAPPGKTIQDQVVVSMDPFIQIETGGGIPFTTTALTWLSQNWQSLGLMFFGVFAIVALRSMVSSAISETKPGDEAEREFGSILPPPVDPEDQEVVVQRADGTTTVVKRSELEEAAGEDSIEKANKLLDRFQNRQPTLREELTELVEADLDAAATVLKSWIGDP